MPNDILGYLLSRGSATAIKRGRPETNNPLSSYFWGWPQDPDRFDASDDGLVRAYLASLWAFRCISLRGRKVAEVPLLVKTEDDQFVDRYGNATDDLSPVRIRQPVLQRFLGTGHEKLRRLIEYDLCISGRCFIEHTQRGLVRLNPATIIIDKENTGITGF